ncbi:hypothetical protein PAXINDRAFT_157684 [Paxillus involutus ATCC 200175]|uniref:Uncharacterized protein n=1 Tax=Paxillus involutus ATCC 200175 TaxID=664439 RepID=A0A0C9T3N9_PAXIN|nr:hypothetical protein PAXINDRAFT_157684 [Paxillus involutus ATCC 200175]
MAPRKETSCKGHLPTMLSSPVKIVASLLEKLSTMDAVADATTTGMQTEIETLILKLQNTSLLGLVSPTTITSETRLQHTTILPISPVRKSTLVLGNDFQPQTSNEALFLALLHESEAANVTLKRHVIELQAANVLNQMYCNTLCGQLAKQEEKEQKGKGSGKLFYEKVVTHEEEQRKKVVAKKSKQVEHEQKGQEIAEWKKLEEARKTKNKARRAEYCAVLKQWKVVKLKAQDEKRKFSEPVIDAQDDGDEAHDSGEEVFLLNDEE